MKVVGQCDGNPIKQVTLDTKEMDSDDRYPLVMKTDDSILIYGTEDQFKSFVSLLMRDLESDRDDYPTKYYLENQSNKIVK